MIDQTQAHIKAQAAADQNRMGGMEILVGYILQVGVLTSAVLIILGTAWNWLQAGSLTTNFIISGENFFGFAVSSLRQLFSGAVSPHLLISLGIITLMFTPYLRVAASAAFFAFVARNWKYTIFTLFVFSVLTYSLFLR